MCTISRLRICSPQGNADSGLGNDAFRAASAAGTNSREGRQVQASSTRLYTAVDKPSISRFALSAMASTPACTSDGELAITFQDLGRCGLPFPVPPLASLNIRTFSRAIRAWSRKDSATAISLSPKHGVVFQPARTGRYILRLRNSGQVQRRVDSVNLMDLALMLGQVYARPIRQVQHFLLDDRAR